MDVWAWAQTCFGMCLGARGQRSRGVPSTVPSTGDLNSGSQACIACALTLLVAIELSLHRKKNSLFIFKYSSTSI